MSTGDYNSVQPARKKRAKRRVRDVLWAIGDRLCHWAGAGSDAGVMRPRLFELGHQIGELGWKLREPR